MIKENNPAVKAIIADSPFRNLEKQSLVLIQKKTKVPKFLAKGFLKIVRSTNIN